MNDTSIKVSKKTIVLLKKVKNHPRETYDDIIVRLLKTYEEALKRGNVE